MLNNKTRSEIAKVITFKHLLINIKAKSPNLYERIKKDYLSAINSGVKYDTDLAILQILESE